MPALFRRHLADVVLGVLGLSMGAVSLLYPYGRDQGLYYYVAREWVLRGSIPYRDVLDHKTPGIYVLYALGVRLFGEQTWGIRVLDLLAVLATGLLAAALTSPRGEPVRPGVRGVALLALGVLYYGHLDFWNTAQSELWYSMLGVGAVWAGLRIHRPLRAEIAAGVFGGAAIVMKPPAIWFVLIAAFVLAHRAFPGREGRWKRLAFASGRFAFGAAIPGLLVLTYFGAHRAVGAMLDIVVGANGYYVKHERGVNGLGEIAARVLDEARVYAPVAPALLLAVVVLLAFALKTKDWPLARRAGLAVALAISGWLAVHMQGKYYMLHWSSMLAPMTVVAATVARAALDRAKLRPPLTASLVAAALVALYAASAKLGGGVLFWTDMNRATWGYVAGKVPREELHKRYKIEAVWFWYEQSYPVGVWLKEHTSPDDLVAVRGFQPEIYAVAERRYGGRFFWTTFIVSPQRAYRRDEWLAEDARALDQHPPKYVVALTGVADGPDSVAWFSPRGYVVDTVMGPFTILRATR
ncbi:MAG: glycosyltransferase family 39 protein [Myxococcales bacterium]|nr:glycosyltransferase family 39 protein [Myxococcales bacterium]